MINSKIITVLLLVLSVWILFSVLSVKLEKEQVKKEERNIVAKISNIRQNNELLEKHIKNFENPEFLEKEVRLRLNYKFPGEEVVFVHKDSTKGSAPVVASDSENFYFKKLTGYKEWLYGLFGR